MDKRENTKASKEKNEIQYSHCPVPLSAKCRDSGNGIFI